MTDAVRPNPNLLDRYLTGLASEAEVVELGRQMLEDPAFAEEFAQACRLDACLSEWFRANKAATDIEAVLSRPTRSNTGDRHQFRKRREIGASPLRLRRFGLAAAAAVVVAAVLAAAFWPRDSRTTPVAPAITGDVLTGSVLAENTPVRQIRAGVEVRTAGDVPAVVRLSDGSEASLQPRAVAVFRGQTDKLRQQVELRQGSIHFEVSKGGGAFEVTTSLGKVTALGTAFTVELLAQGPYEKGAGTMKFKHVMLAVAVMSGAVQVNFGGRDYQLGPGDNCLFAADAEKGSKINIVSGKLTKVDSGSITIANQGKGGGEVTKDIPLDASTKILVQTAEMETIQVPAKGGDGTVSAQRPKVRDGTTADLVVDKRVEVKVGSDGKALEILVLNSSLKAGGTGASGGTKIGSISGELTQVDSGSVAIGGQGKGGGTTETTFSLDAQTKILVETDEMETIQVPAKGGDGTVSVQRPKVRDGSIADLVVGKKVSAKVSAGKAIEILVLRPAPAKGGTGSGVQGSGVKASGVKESGVKESSGGSGKKAP